MKKIKRILLAVTFILCSMMTFACGKNSKDNTKVYDGVTYVHDPENKRITAGGHTYSYIWSEYGYRNEDGYGYEEEYEDGYIISITYPDGEEVVVRYAGNHVSSEGHRLQGKEYADPLAGSVNRKASEKPQKGQPGKGMRPANLSGPFWGKCLYNDLLVLIKLPVKPETRYKLD
jgi:hypothetical protein